VNEILKTCGEEINFKQMSAIYSINDDEESGSSSSSATSITDEDDSIKQTADDEDNQTAACLIDARMSVGNDFSIMARNEHRKYLSFLYYSTLRMLRARGGNAKYCEIDQLVSDAKHFYETQSPADFVFDRLLSSKIQNPLRDIMAYKIKKRCQTQSLRSLMSFIIQNADNRTQGSYWENEKKQTYTAVFFVCKRKMQVPKKIVENMFSALLILKQSRDIVVTETIFISAAPFSSDMESQRKGICANQQFHFSQIILDEEVLIPPNDYAWTPKVTILSSAQAESLVKENDISLSQLQHITHTDALMKYLGIRPNTVVRIERPQIVPGFMRKSELTYAVVF
jgi:DNA-directed RNA polymerase subunit H (RpoH/RPB5)